MARRKFSLSAGAPVAAMTLVVGLVAGATSIHAQSGGRTSSVEIAGRSWRCGNVPIVMDRRFPSIAAAEIGMGSRGGPSGGGRLILNPNLLADETETVRVFIFHHECGHTRVGGSELGADCWAVGEGVRTGWLTRGNLREVCRSFADMPETSTHPSGARRCRNLDQCFATALAAQPPSPDSVAQSPPPLPTRTAAVIPRPQLVRSGYLTARTGERRPCPPVATVAAGARDPIARLLEQQETQAKSAGCR